MNALSTHSTDVRSVRDLRLACTRLSSRKARKFLPFVSATANAHQQSAAAATVASKRSTLQQIALAAAALSLGTAVDLSAPAASDAYLVQFPVADLRNQYFLVCNNNALCLPFKFATDWPVTQQDRHTQTHTPRLCIFSAWLQVRAGQGQCEADNYVLTNTVFKTSISNGLSSQGKRQVARQVVRLTAVSALSLLASVFLVLIIFLSSVMQIVPALRELDACPDGGCWLWPSITQRSYQTAEILASLLGTGYSRIVPEYSFLDQRCVMWHVTPGVYSFVNKHAGGCECLFTLHQRIAKFMQMMYRRISTQSYTSVWKSSGLTHCTFTLGLPYTAT